MKKIKDLFIEKQSYIIEYNYDDRYYMWIEALDENGASIQDEKFDFKNIEGVLIELHDRNNNYDTFCEWNELIHYDCEIETLKSICSGAIRQYEQNQGDIYTVYVYEDEEGDDLMFTEDFFDEKQAIRYADKFVEHYGRVEVIDPDGDKIY